MDHRRFLAAIKAAGIDTTEPGAAPKLAHKIVAYRLKRGDERRIAPAVTRRWINGEADPSKGLSLIHI